MRCKLLLLPGSGYSTARAPQGDYTTVIVDAPDAGMEHRGYRAWQNDREQLPGPPRLHEAITKRIRDRHRLLTPHSRRVVR